MLADESNPPILPDVPSGTRVLVMVNAVMPDELRMEENYHEIFKDMQQTFSEFGAVKQVCFC